MNQATAAFCWSRAHLRQLTLAVVLLLAAAVPAVANAAKSETDFLSYPAVARLFTADGRDAAAKLDGHGAFPGATGGRKGGIAVEYQRHGYEIIAAGVAAHDSKLIVRGLDALEWGLAQAGRDGSFPEERGGTERKEHGLHPKAVFLEAAAHSVLLLRATTVDQRLKVRADALVPKLKVSALWMMNSDDLQDFVGRVKNTNQLLSAALALHEIGLLTNDARLTSAGQQLVQKSLERQTGDGTLPEKGGFDSNYQSLSLEFLARYALTLPQSPWRDAVVAALRKGTDRFTRAIRADGSFDTQMNTRTVACGAAVPGNGAKGRDVDVLPRRLRYLGYVLDTSTRLDALADKVLARGQGFSHAEKCDRNDDSVDDGDL